jgi:hypothetical protein
MAVIRAYPVLSVARASTRKWWKMVVNVNRLDEDLAEDQPGSTLHWSVHHGVAERFPT